MSPAAIARCGNPKCRLGRVLASTMKGGLCVECAAAAKREAERNAEPQLRMES